MRDNTMSPAKRKNAIFPQYPDDRTISILSDGLCRSGPDAFLSAPGGAAKAFGMARLAEGTGLSRESLYRTFSPNTKPRFETIWKMRSLPVCL
jgi:probable addiction module antidote protein